MKFEMQNLILFLMVIVCSGSISAQVSISTPISVTDGNSTFGKKSPRLAVNGNGEVMVFWMKTGSEAFYLSTKTASGFTEPVQIPFGGLNPNLWSGSLGPNMAAKGDHVYVTFEVYGDAIYVTHSSDAGQNWDAPVAAFTPPDGRRATIPTIAVDAQGQPYVAYVNTDVSEGDAHYGLVRSTDFGSTYLPEVDASSESNGEEVCECCNGHVDVAANGDIYVAFRNNNANLRDIWMVRSTDGGMTFTDAFDMDETDWTASVCPNNGPHFALLDDEVVSVFFSGSGSSGNGVYYSSLDTQLDEVQSTNYLLTTDPMAINQNRPRVAGSGDSVAVIWQEYVNGSHEIVMSVSASGSEGINSESFLLTELPSNQLFPEVIFANGKFHVVYEDSESNTVLYQEVSSAVVGFDEIEQVQFEFSPNPSSDFIRFKSSLSGSFVINIIDNVGRLVLVEEMRDGDSSMSVAHLNPGVYQLVMIQNEQVGTKKLIVN